MSYLWNPVPVPVFTSTGAFAAGAFAYFYSGNSSTPITVYQDAALSIPHPWPVVADLSGTFPPIYIPYGLYRRRITTSLGALISDAGNIDNTAPPTGGGGIVVTADQVLQTGDPIWRMRTGQMTGFVRMNGNTLGSASSGATEYAASNAQNLFLYLWNLPNSIAAVSGGRGASATADFNANKTIVIPTMQGYLAAGLDDMGATSSNTIQVTTTCSATNANANVTVTSATGLARGMFVIIDGVASGAISSISGTTVTLSAPYGGTTGGGKVFRASFFSDAQQVGQNGGAQSATMTAAELAAHNHTITDPGHNHALNGLSSGAISGGVPFLYLGGTGLNTSTSTTGITGTNNTGTGLPSSIVQPTRLGTWYMHL